MADEETIELEEKLEEVVETSVDPLEEIALDMGWTPQDKWRGDESKFKDAASYIRDTAKAKDATARELKALKETTSRISQVTETLFNEKLAEREAHWKDEHRRAVDMGDHEAAGRAVEELTKAKPATPIPPETQDFMARNASWFNVDPLATERAIAVAESYSKAGFSPADQIAKAEQQIRKEFPELFPATKPAPQVAAPGSRQAAASNRNPVDMLPPEALAVAKDMEERLGVPVAKFAEKWVQDNKGKSK